MFQPHRGFAEGPYDTGGGSGTRLLVHCQRNSEMAFHFRFELKVLKECLLDSLGNDGLARFLHKAL